MHLLLLALTAPAPAMDCDTPAALRSLQGLEPPRRAAFLVPPPQIHRPPGPPPPDRTIYGTPWDDHVETEHFTIQWWDASVTDAQVQQAADALELGWQSFVEAQGWPAPVSSDTYYLWVLLDPDLGSTTGYTTEYFDDAYPDGLPVIYLNPTTLEDFGSAFYASLSVHELMHAIQFGMRPYNWDSDVSELEGWYWEASATHASELADPTIDGHQYTSAWYADQPHEPYYSYEGSHQYGMFVFNAWLDHALGAGSMQATWALSADRAGTPWPDILAEATGQAAPSLWAAFTDAYGNRTLPESAAYTPAAEQGHLSSGDGGTLAELGTHYWRVDADVVVTPDSDDVILGGADAPGAAVRTGGPTVLSVTAVSASTSYALAVAEPDSDTGDPASDDDPTPGSLPGDTDSDSDKGGGCSTWAGSAGGLAPLLVAGALRRRRRLSPSER